MTLYLQLTMHLWLYFSMYGQVKNQGTLRSVAHEALEIRLTNSRVSNNYDSLA